VLSRASLRLSGDDRRQVGRWEAGGRLVGRKQEAKLLPGVIGERRETEQLGGLGKQGGNVGSLNRPVISMTALSLGLMPEAEVGPPQAP